MNFTIKSGEKLGVTGFNGIGKSTLMKTLIGELPVVAGSFKFVDNAMIAYFSQEHTWDDDSITPLQEISNLYPKMEEKEIRSYLARSGLRGPLALQPIKTLSGGEQAKLKLCKMMLKKANILIFDEPTNHLDQNAKEGLVKALKSYPGTVIIVTHEQSFLKEVVTSVYDFEELLLS
jgi:ATPase subunit of ABC transporter with duplicated ATPase domains